MKKYNSNSISRNNTYNGAGAGGGGTASDISYDNSLSGLVSENVQQAIDELHDEIENGTVFVTDEVAVGEWANGETLYRKCYTYNGDNITSSFIIDNSLTETYCNIITMRGTWHSATENRNYSIQANVNEAYVRQLPEGLHFNLTNVSMSRYDIIVEYTKN